MNILRPLPAKLDHLYLFDPCRAKNLSFDLSFNNFETVRRRWIKLCFFWIVITRGICLYGSRQHWRNFWIWPLYKLSCDPHASCTGCDPAAIWNGDSWIRTNIMKLSNHLFLFSWVNFRSVRLIIEPICIQTNLRSFLIMAWDEALHVLAGGEGDWYNLMWIVWGKRRGRLIPLNVIFI